MPLPSSEEFAIGVLKFTGVLVPLLPERGVLGGAGPPLAVSAGVAGRNFGTENLDKSAFGVRCFGVKFCCKINLLVPSIVTLYGINTC